MRWKLRPILAIALWLSLAGCDSEPSVDDASFEASPEALQLLQEVRGGWMLTGTVEDSCPDEASVPFPLGQTKWSDVGGTLEVEGLGAQASILSLWPIDGSTFGRDLSMLWGGCEARQTWTLHIEARTSGTMSGVFTSTSDLTDALTCVHDPRGLGLPCESRVTWSAVRTQ